MACNTQAKIELREGKLFLSLKTSYHYLEFSISHLLNVSGVYHTRVKCPALEIGPFRVSMYLNRTGQLTLGMKGCLMDH